MILRSFLLGSLLSLLSLQACGSGQSAVTQAAAAHVFINAGDIYSVLSKVQGASGRTALFSRIGDLSLSSYYELVSSAATNANLTVEGAGVTQSFNGALHALEGSREGFLALGSDFADIRALWNASGLYNPAATQNAEFLSSLSSIMKSQLSLLGNSDAASSSTRTTSATTSTSTTTGSDGGCAESKVAVTHSISSACLAADLTPAEAALLHCGDVAALATQRVTECTKVDAQGKTTTQTSVSGTTTGNVDSQTQGGSQGSGFQDLGTQPYSPSPSQNPVGFGND